MHISHVFPKRHDLGIAGKRAPVCYLESHTGVVIKDSYFDLGPFTSDDDPSEETTTEWGPTLGSMVTAVAMAGFHVDTNRITLLDESDGVEELPLMTKAQVADAICDRTASMLD